MKQRRARFSKWMLAILLIAIIGAMSWRIQWATYARPPLPEAITALESDALIAVTINPWLVFIPAQTTPNTGFSTAANHPGHPGFTG